MRQPSAAQNYISRLIASFISLWGSRDCLNYKNVRLSHLQYFLALPLSLVFANTSEMFFNTDVQLMGLDGTTIIFSVYCLGVALLFAFSSVRNIRTIALVSVILSLAGFMPWVFMPDGVAAVLLAAVFMFGMRGSVACAVFVYAFVLNNPERFLGSVIISFSYAAMTIATGLSAISPIISRVFMFLLVVGTAVCLSMFKTESFAGLAQKRKAKLNPSILLVLYFFVSGYCVDYYYSYIPGTSEPGALVLYGLFGVVAVCLSVVLQITVKRSAWHLCNLFLIAMIFSYALFFAPAGSFLWNAAVSLYGFRLTGYLLMFYLLGGVFKKHGDFRLFKICVVVVFTASMLTYIIPDAISKHAPELLLPAAILSSCVIFIVFMMLSPAYARHLFSDDWSEDFHRLDMTEAKKKVAEFNQLEGLHLTPREKEIAAFLLRGMTARQISGELGISFNTANFHIKNLYRKLGITGRMELFSRFGVTA